MGELLSRSSPTPLQELADKGVIKTNPQFTNRQSAQAVACFCSRERLGATKTPSAKRVDWLSNGTSRRRPLPGVVGFPCGFINIYQFLI